MKAKARVREEVWQRDQEQSRRNRELVCVGNSQSEAERHNAGFHSWSLPLGLSPLFLSKPVQGLVTASALFFP